jgi:hypothetical protein
MVQHITTILKRNRFDFSPNFDFCALGGLLPAGSFLCVISVLCVIFGEAESLYDADMSARCFGALGHLQRRDANGR